MSDSMPPPPPPPPPAGGYGGPPPPALGVPRPGELLDRFLARLIDGVILGIVGGILIAILSAILISDTTYNIRTGEFEGGSLILYYIVLGIVLAPLYIGYQGYLESTRGQSVGKMIMKLKVYGPDGVSNPTMEQALRRNIFLAAPIAFIVPIVGPIIGGLAALAGEIMIAVGINSDTVKRQAWHDQFAGGTTVMKIG